MNKKSKKEFDALAKDEPKFSKCPACGYEGQTRFMDRHHPCGTFGSNALRYVRMHRQCHRWAHDNPAAATRMGILWKSRNTREVTDKEWCELLQLMNLKDKEQ